jgi:hypothetical protein
MLVFEFCVGFAAQSIIKRHIADVFCRLNRLNVSNQVMNLRKKIIQHFYVEVLIIPRSPDLVFI